MFKQTPIRGRKEKKIQKLQLFSDTKVNTSEKHYLFVLPGFKNSKEMKIAKNYGAFCNYCKRKVNERFKEIVVEAKELNDNSPQTTISVRVNESQDVPPAKPRPRSKSRVSIAIEVEQNNVVCSKKETKTIRRSTQ